MDDVPVPHRVILALQPPPPGIFRPLLPPASDKILEGDHLGADEAFLEIRVDDPRRLPSGGAPPNRPSADFLLPGGEEGVQPQQLVPGADDPVQPRLPQAQIREELRLFRILQFGDLRLQFAANRRYPRPLGGGHRPQRLRMRVGGGALRQGILAHIGDVQNGLGG